MRDLDRLTVEEYGVSEEVLMENAGLHVADLVRQEFSREVKIAVICGRGNNGGDGFVAARRLLGWGYNIEVYTPFEDEELGDLALKKLETVRKVDSDAEMRDFPTANIYIDALVGYGLDGEPRGNVADAVEKLEEWSAETISVDVPTGVDVDTGEGYTPHVSPKYTVTFGLPKKGLREGNAGKIYVADIGIPVDATEEIGVNTRNLFTGESMIELESVK